MRGGDRHLGAGGMIQISHGQGLRPANSSRNGFPRKVIVVRPRHRREKGQVIGAGVPLHNATGENLSTLISLACSMAWARSQAA